MFLDEFVFAIWMKVCLTIQNLLSDVKTPCERRFGECHPVHAKEQSRIHQFAKKISPGLFLGYTLCAVWNLGDILVADTEDRYTIFEFIAKVHELLNVEVGR